MSAGNFTVAFITGHSVRGCTGLSQEQRDFQQRSGIPLEHWQPHNFPYQKTFPFPEPFQLLSASFNNVCHYLSSRHSSFAAAHRASVSEHLSTYDTILLLAGSCGLELFNNLHLPEGIRRRIHLFAYGPISRRLPEAASYQIVQGTQDFLSRLYHPRADHRYPCPHMGYLLATETLHHFKAYARRVLGHLPEEP
jgi:hypothetical protein